MPAVNKIFNSAGDVNSTVIGNVAQITAVVEAVAVDDCCCSHGIIQVAFHYREI